MKTYLKYLIGCCTLLAGLGIGAMSAGAAVVHDASILTVSNGVSFSFIHKSVTGCVACGNSSTKSLTGDFNYDWTQSGDPFEVGSTIDFTESVIAFTNSLYTVELFTNLTTNATNQLIVSADSSPTDLPHDIGGFTVTEKIYGDFEVTISKNDGSEIFSDVVVLDSTFDMGPVDGIGQNPAGEFGTFLWGYTSSFGTSGLCDPNTTSGACTMILAEFTGNEGFGVDLAFDGAPIPLPPALVLFLGALTGLGGLGYMNRRREQA